MQLRATDELTLEFGSIWFHNYYICLRPWPNLFVIQMLTHDLCALDELLVDFTVQKST